jgi:uncharacterized protein DUF1064
MAIRVRGWPGQPGPKRHKYFAKKIQVDGEWFDSQSEAVRYGELRMLQRAGQIRGLQRQVKFPIVINGESVKIRSEGYPNGRAVTYIADYVYFEGEARVVEDRKGMDTPISRLKRALIEAIYHVKVRVTK